MTLKQQTFTCVLDVSITSYLSSLMITITYTPSHNLGVGLTKNGTRLVTFSTPRGVFETCSTPTLKGLQMCFHCDKGVEGVALMSEFQIFPINSMTLLSFMLLKGFILMFKRANVRMTGADGGHR